MDDDDASNKVVCLYVSAASVTGNGKTILEKKNDDQIDI